MQVFPGGKEECLAETKSIRPEVDSVLSMRCEVYDGSTYLCSAYLDLGVCVSFP